MQKGVTCSISPHARWALSRLKEKKQYHSPQDREIQQALGNTVEFTDSYIETDHPCVDQRWLDRLREIDPRLELHWELQHYFEHRWHIMYMDETWDTGTRELKSILILQEPFAVQIHEQALYLPTDNEMMERHIERLMFQLRNGTQSEATDRVATHAEERPEKLAAERKDMADALDREQRLIQERISGKRNISDPGWERGIGMDESGKPFVDGPGAHTQKNTKAF